MRRTTSRRPLLALAALTTLALGACVGDGDELITDVDATAGPLFNRYVALGNSITAGFQSGGLVDSLQLRAYPVVLAARAGADFGVPLFARPGCPAPFTAPLTPAVGTPPCALRQATVPPVVQNLAVPGVRIAELFTLPTDASIRQVYTLVTGGRTQADAMIAAEPTFVSAWIGNNDALGAALSGRLGPLAAGADSNLTRLSVFQAQVGNLVNAIRASGAQGAILAGVVDPVVTVPLLQPGAYFFLARDAAGAFRGKPVNANCSPVTALGQPNPLSANMVSFQIVTSALPEINCDPAAAPGGGSFLLDAAEIAVVRTRIAQYNAALQAAATQNNWAYVDPNVTFAQQVGQTTTVGGQQLFQNVRKCQALASATNAAEIQSAVLRSCPVTGPTAAPNFFGSLFSFDGVHPSTAAHRLIAGTFATAINAKYGTQLSTSTS